jgi:hypothetical protein
MRRIFFVTLLVAFASATAMPTLGKLLGFDVTAIAAKKAPQPERCIQGGNDDFQGDEDCQ